MTILKYDTIFIINTIYYYVYKFVPPNSNKRSSLNFLLTWDNNMDPKWYPWNSSLGANERIHGYLDEYRMRMYIYHKNTLIRKTILTRSLDDSNGKTIKTRNHERNENEHEKVFSGYESHTASRWLHSLRVVSMKVFPFFLFYSYTISKWNSLFIKKISSTYSPRKF